MFALLAMAARADEPALRPWTRGETPKLEGKDAAGKPIALGDYRGRVVLVQFWASWCESCADELPALAALRARFAGRPFDVLTVNFGEGPARVEQFRHDHPFDLPVLLDRERHAGEAWGVGGLPMGFLVDGRGKIRGWVFGESDWTRGELAVALERLVLEAEGRRTASADEPR